MIYACKIFLVLSLAPENTFLVIPREIIRRAIPLCFGLVTPFGSFAFWSFPFTAAFYRTRQLPKYRIRIWVHIAGVHYKLSRHLLCVWQRRWVDMDRRRKRFLLQSENILRSGPPDDGIFLGDFKMNLCYVTSYDRSCPHYYQENLFSVMGTPNSIESEQFLLQVKKKGTNHVQ